MPSSTWPVEDVRARPAWRAVVAVWPQVWGVDDTGFPKDGRASPGVARQYSGTLGKVGNCQIGVSLHAASDSASCPLSWRLFLPAAWDGPDAEAAGGTFRIWRKGLRRSQRLWSPGSSYGRGGRTPRAGQAPGTTEVVPVPCTARCRARRPSATALRNRPRPTRRHGGPPRVSFPPSAGTPQDHDRSAAPSSAGTSVSTVIRYAENDAACIAAARCRARSAAGGEGVVRNGVGALQSRCPLRAVESSGECGVPTPRCPSLFSDWL
ncbi:hypothetical protein BSL84_33305 [Streptomyces sp. TN58]|nr:hypothetical protein BSL84_33305 [Streptomyces sp. TN58]